MDVPSLPSPGGYERAYDQSYRLAFDRLSQLDLDGVCRSAGAIRNGDLTLQLTFIGTDVAIDLQHRTVESGERTLSMTDKLVILHYLVTADGTTATGNLLSFKELPGGLAYSPNFDKRAVAPVLARYGDKPENLFVSAEALGGEPAVFGDAAVSIQALPRVVMFWVLWIGDGDFETEGSVLFDSSISHYLPTEDIAVLCQSIAAFLSACQHVKR
ncbi:DUF3786 domain-containing protein [Dehalogenimonas alkenigignens]|uniref:DUF3786 domain-containing protein n=1 Tax=Dehalogenimonas alkenigignens TaxID=1217799 RepID=A0A0W0GJ62_9CHLR|nr:protein of unknown function (DUF3786) [Dehalogenimonas alkenigignens]PVV84955.1 DUF3786 domain-containing protein [Dehalogenimonas alkenigignens]